MNGLEIVRVRIQSQTVTIIPILIHVVNVIVRDLHVTTLAVEKAISITHSECVFVALGIQHAKRIRNTIIYGQPGCTIFLHIF